MNNKSTTINIKEVEKFSALSSKWWDESGPFKALHRLNLIRLSYVKYLIANHFKRDHSEKHALDGLKILDAGCGGGLLSEPLCRMGATVHGIDPAEDNIEIAKKHAETFGLKIAYNTAAVEDLPVDKTYQIIVALEVLEHTPNPERFLAECHKRLMPGGLLIVSTLNRTIRSYIEGIVTAEHILKWVPKGTHDWAQFLKPSELHKSLNKAGFSDAVFQGISYVPLNDEWTLSDTLEVNYFASATK